MYVPPIPESENIPLSRGRCAGNQLRRSSMRIKRKKSAEDKSQGKSCTRIDHLWTRRDAFATVPGEIVTIQEIDGNGGTSRVAFHSRIFPGFIRVT